MRLASYNIRGRPSFGAVVGDGIVDLRARLSRVSTSLLEVFRAQALDQAKAAAAGVRAGHAACRGGTAAAAAGAGKNPLHRHQLCQPRAERLRRRPSKPKYPSMFYSAPNSLVGHGQNLIAAEDIRAARLRGRDRPRDRPRLQARRRRSARSDYVAGITLCNEGTIRDWIRHGQFNVTQGKNFDATGSIGPWIDDRRRSDEAAAPRRAQERRGDAGRHHGEHDLLVRRHHRLCDDLHDAQARRHHLLPARR